MHFQAEINALFYFHSDTFVILLQLLAVYNSDITKFMWGQLRGISPTTFWPWG